MGIRIWSYHGYKKKTSPPLFHSQTPLNSLFLKKGPFGANIFNPRSWGNSSSPDDPINDITIEFTRVVLAIGVFAIGVELPKAYMAKHWKSLFFLIVPGMTWVRLPFIFIFVIFNLIYQKGMVRLRWTHKRVNPRPQLPLKPSHIRLSHSNRSYPSISSGRR